MVISQLGIVALMLTTFALILLGGLLLVYRRLKATLMRATDAPVEPANGLLPDSGEPSIRERDPGTSSGGQRPHLFEEVFLQSTEAMQIVDREGNRLRVSGEWYRLFGRRASAVDAPYNLFEDPAIRQAGLTAVFRRAVREGVTAEGEVSLASGKETEPTRRFHLRAHPISRDGGGFGCLIVYYEDITERRRDAEATARLLREKELLLRESNHRMKNNLQLMKSILNLQARAVTDPVALRLFAESANRIKAMALVHEKLCQHDGVGTVAAREYLSTIASRLHRSYATPQLNVQIRTELDEVELDVHTAIPCGLLANELLSNALKYAFDGRRHGTLLLTFRRLQARAYPTANRKPAFLLGVSDNGRGIPTGSKEEGHAGLGLELVSSLVEQLDGQLLITDRRPGTVVEVRFPACG